MNKKLIINLLALVIFTNKTFSIVPLLPSKTIISIEKSLDVTDTSRLLLLKKQFENTNQINRLEYANTLLNIGKLYRLSENFKASNLYLFQATKILIKLKSNKTLEGLDQIALNFISLNDYINALKYFEIIAKIAPNFGSYPKILYNSYHQQSFIYFNSGDYQKSLEKSNNATHFAKLYHNNLLIAIALKDKAKVLNKLKNYAEAQNAIDEAIRLANIENDKLNLGLMYLTKGYIFRDQKEIDKALIFFFKASDIYTFLNEKAKYSLVGIDIGLMYYKKQEYEKSIFYSKKALNGEPNHFTKVQLNDNLGGAYYEQKNFEKALFCFQKALTTKDFFNFTNTNLTSLPQNHLLKKTDFKSTFLTVLADKALCWLGFAKSTKNNPQRLGYALQTYELADKLIEYMRHEHTENLSKLYWRNKTRPIYESAIETCFLLKDYEKAFYFFEKSRSVMLNDKINEMGAKQKLSESDQKKEKEFVSKIFDLSSKIEKEKDARKIENLKVNLSDLEESKAHFIKTLEAKNPAYYQMKYDTITMNLAEMQAYLKTNFKGKPATLVEYFVGESSTYALIISANKTEIKKITYDENLAKNFLRFTSKKLNTKAELDSFQNVSLALNNQLIKPLNVTKGHLIISQDGSFLPFEAMAQSTKAGDFLINSHPISYTYSAQFLMKNKSEKSFFPNKNFIGFAPVNFSDLASLSGSKKSISNLAAHYFLNTKLIEKEATKSNFLSQANQYKIVQLYTHALADSIETEPRIFFADSSLKVSELSAENKFKTQLLVLSACKTGVGKLAKGEGILSLARGFSMLGIPATITSLWSVEDADVYTITELFYTYLNQGFSKDEALQKAKIEFLENAGNTQPYAWAGLVLVGETEPINSIQANLWFILAILLIVLMACSLAKLGKSIKKSFKLLLIGTIINRFMFARKVD